MWLKERDASVSVLASRLLYESEAAFARAFKRHMGVSPGAARWNRAALPGGAPEVADSSSAKRAAPRTHRA